MIDTDAAMNIAATIDLVIAGSRDKVWAPTYRFGVTGPSTDRLFSILTANSTAG